MLSEPKRVAALARWIETRRSAGLSIEDLAAVFGVAPSTVRRWENPNHPSAPDSRRLIELSEICDVSPTWLLCGVGPQKLSDVAMLADSLLMLEKAESVLRESVKLTEKWKLRLLEARSMRVQPTQE